MSTRQELPERRSEPRTDAGDIHQAALLIDFDNVTMGIRSNLGQELRNLLNSDMIRGKVAVQRAYADWRRYPQYIVPLSEASIDLIFAPAYGSSKKNATDIRLAIDALELVFIRPEIRTFILMSGDSDFSSLVLKLKEYGKYVIGVGIQESSSDLLVQNCDEYYSYSALSGLSREGDQPVERHDPWVLVEKAMEKMVQRGDTMRSDRLKQVMLEIDPSFNEKEQGFTKFNRFVVEAASRGMISIQKMENGQYGVAPAGKSPRGGKSDRRARTKKAPTERAEVPTEKAAASEKPEGRRKGRERGKARATEDSDRGGGERPQTRRARPKLTMASALGLLNRALDQLLDDKTDQVRDSDVKRRLLELHPDFDEGELGFSKFSKFLQAAEEQKAIELSRGPNGNYHVRRPPKGRKERLEQEGPAEESAVSLPEGEARETTVKRLARFLFGAKKEEGLAPRSELPIGSEEEIEAAMPQARLVEATQPEESASERGPRARDRDRGDQARAQRGRSRGSRGESRGRRETGDAERRKSEHERSKHREPPTSSGRREALKREPERGELRERQGARARERERSEARQRERLEARERQAAKPGEREAPEARQRGGPAARQPERPTESRAAPAREVVEESAAGAGERAQEKGIERQEGKREPAVEAAPLPGAPRRTIRGRWGTRGRYRPAETPPPIFEGQRHPGAREREQGGDGGTSEAPESGSQVGNAHIVEHLKSHYTGVGAKTAETLVETFGADLFRVLDEDPDRVRAVLPDHRADRVLEARRQEREAETE